MNHLICSFVQWRTWTTQNTHKNGMLYKKADFHGRCVGTQSQNIQCKTLNCSLFLCIRGNKTLRAGFHLPEIVPTTSQGDEAAVGSSHKMLGERALHAVGTPAPGHPNLQIICIFPLRYHTTSCSHHTFIV